MGQGDDVRWFLVLTLALTALISWPIAIPIGAVMAGEIVRRAYSRTDHSYTPA